MLRRLNSKAMHVCALFLFIIKSHIYVVCIVLAGEGPLVYCSSSTSQSVSLYFS